MGMPCFSKPLNLFWRRNSVVVHPQEPPQITLENGHHPQPNTPTSVHMPPPTNLTPQPKEQKPPPPPPWAATRFLTPKPAPPDRLTIVTPSSADLSMAMTSSGLTPPRTPVHAMARRVSDFFTKPLPGEEQSEKKKQPTKKKPDLNRHPTKNSLLGRRRSRTSFGKQSSIMGIGGGGRRTPSAFSDTSSMLGLSDGLAGLYALASLTAYETKLVPVIWQSCLEQNEYYCEHVLSRLFNRHPELEDMFEAPLINGNEEAQCPVSTINKKTSSCTDSSFHMDQIVQEKSHHVFAFLTRLIMIHELDYDRLLEECEQLGRSHAVYYYERGLQPYHWDAFAISVVQEYKKTHMNVDMQTDEKELQQLAWTHFTTAVISAIKENFEEELQRMTPPMFGAQVGDRDSSASGKNAFRF